MAPGRLVVAIDFGTTKVAAAFAHVPSSNGGNSNVLQEALSPSNITAVTFGDDDSKTEEISSICAYLPVAASDQPSAYDRQLYMGSQVKRAVMKGKIGLDEAFRFIKLALLDANHSQVDNDVQEMAKQLQEAIRNTPFPKSLATGQKQERSVEEVMRAAYDYIWNIVERRIEDQVLSMARPDEWQTCPMTLRLTVPSNFGEAQIQKLRRCAHTILQREGRKGREVMLEVIKESTAAIIGTLEMARREIDVKEGEALLVVDIGGGTADLQIVKIDAWSGPNQSIAVSEDHEGIGGSFGSAISEIRFRQFIEQRIDTVKREQLLAKDCSLTWTQIMAHLLNGFEKEKRDPSKDPCILDCPGLPSMPGDWVPFSGITLPGHEITIPLAMLRECIAPSLDGIVTIIQQQIAQYLSRKKSLKKIIIVGGGSKSTMLRSRLADALGSQYRLIYPTVNMISLVSQGAVLSNANVLRRRVLQASYGYAQDRVYDRRKHGRCWRSPTDDAPRRRRTRRTSSEAATGPPPGFAEVVRSWYEPEVDYAVRRIQWAFQRGQSIEHQAVFTHSGWRYIEIYKDKPSFVLEDLYMSTTGCQDESAIDDPANRIEKVANLYAEIPHPERFGWPRVQRKVYDSEARSWGTIDYYDCDYETTTRLEGLRLSWRLEIRPRQGFEDPCAMQHARAFVQEADFQVDRAFEPRVAGEVAALRMSGP